MGPSDEIGKMNFPAVHHICRGPDAYLNKPTKIATPLDLTFSLGFDSWQMGLDSLPFVQHAYSTISSHSTVAAAQRWHYLLAVDLAQTVSVTLADLGLPAGGRHIAFEYFPECWRNESAAEHGHCTFELGRGHTQVFDSSQALHLEPGGVRGDGLSATQHGSRPFRYVVTAPVLANDWVLLGETGKYFCATSDRFSGLELSRHPRSNEFLSMRGKDAATQNAAGSLWNVVVKGAPLEHVMVQLVRPKVIRTIFGEQSLAARSKAFATIVVQCALNAMGRAMLQCNDSSCTCF
eukprot:COSAG06_NODE_6114_length_3104_cov_1.875874_2_plen_292_part_00